ncbi:MAG TPA: branched-chain amino acid ABC transporter ATP-binding protein/permease [Candidatus Dormibacteraeota bacterium]|nr:branched-chain amino acid ABC transporter ATP-binding protein/permease [Candidatus Dormibacteraeota bacterium]
MRIVRIGPGTPLLAVVLVVLPVFLDLYKAHVAVLILLFVMVAIGLSLVMGFGGQVNLAQAAFFGTGAYVSAILTSTYGWNPWLAAPVAILSTCLMALVVGLPALRVQSHYLGIVSLGLAVAFASLLTNATFTGGASGISKIPPLPMPGVDLTDDYNDYYLVLAVLALLVALARLIAGTTLGRRLRAMRDDTLAAAASGIEIPYYRLLAFLLGGLFAGVAGVFYAHIVRYVSPDTFGLDTMFLLLAMVIIGGQDSVWGAAVGAALLIAARNLLTGLEAYQQLVYGALIVATVVFAPRGLAGAASAARRRLSFPWPTLPFPVPGPRRPPAPPPSVPEVRDPGAPATVALKVEAVSKRFRGLAALSEVSLEVAAGEIHGIIGPNGSGKTTLFNVISGIERPNGGRVEVHGRDVTGRRAHQMSRLGVARTFQNLRLFPRLTVVENVMVALDRDPVRAHLRYLVAPWSVLARERRHRERALRLLAEFRLESVAGEPAVSLPYGRQRQVEIARALAGRPSLLLLDEPAAGLNAAEQEDLKALIRRIRDAGVTVIVIEHNMGLVMSVCERLTVLAHGRVIASGTPWEVSRDAQVIEAYLGRDTAHQEAV